MPGTWLSLRPLLQLTFQTALLLLWAFMTWQRYAVYKSELTTAAVTVEPMPFPAFSVCPEFPTEYAHHPLIQNKGYLEGVFWKYFNESIHGNVTNFLLLYVQAPMQEYIRRFCVGKNRCSSQLEDSWELVITRRGVCFTFRPQHQSAVTDAKRQRVTFKLSQPYGGVDTNKNVLHFDIYIHGDESLATSTRQEYASFHFTEAMNSNILRHTFKVERTQTISANTQKRPCNPDPSYQRNLCMDRCLWRTVVAEVGCRGPWMLLPDVPQCETGELIQRAATLEDDIGLNRQLVVVGRYNSSIPNPSCECPARCSVDTFILAEDIIVHHPPDRFIRNKKAVLELDRESVVTTSSVSYGLVSFLSEAGGNGGLLLGYSLMTVLDVVLDLVLKLVNRPEGQAR